MVKLLFVLRNKTASGPDYTASAESGVGLSTQFLVKELEYYGINAKSAGITDPSELDHVITLHRPTHVIVETFWINPTVFDDLIEAHPFVKFIVRDHSDSCFRVYEENAFGWIVEYLKRGIEVMSNSLRSADDIVGIADAAEIDESLVTYGPNVYPIPSVGSMRPHTHKDGIVDIGCFGAVRPMKNHITQAIAAVKFAQEADLTLNFHINGYNIPGYIDPILNNLRSLFSEFANCNLVEHGWMSHADFLTVLDGIDICTQVSFTETFNIVAADAMSRSVPLITSSEVPWIGSYAHRNTTSSKDICEGFLEIWTEGHNARKNRLLWQRYDMEVYSVNALTVWTQRFDRRCNIF